MDLHQRGKSQSWFESHTTEDVSPATGSPRFVDQGAIPEGRIVGTEIENYVADDLGSK